MQQMFLNLGNVYDLRNRESSDYIYCSVAKGCNKNLRDTKYLQLGRLGWNVMQKSISLKQQIKIAKLKTQPVKQTID
jgi:hypothetical protein